jgi:carbohydrate-selective porin OprB
VFSAQLIDFTLNQGPTAIRYPEPKALDLTQSSFLFFECRFKPYPFCFIESNYFISKIWAGVNIEPVSSQATRLRTQKEWYYVKSEM